MVSKVVINGRKAMLKKRWCCNSTLSNFCGTRPRELDSQGPAASHVKSSSGVLFCKAPQSPNNFQDVGENSKRKYVLSKMTPRVPTSEGHNSTSSFRKILPLASSNSRPKTAQVTNFSKDSREVNLSRIVLALARCGPGNGRGVISRQ